MVDVSSIGSDIVQEEIDRNTNNRISWKSIIGMSLNKYVAIQKESRLNGKQIYCKIIYDYPDLNIEHKRRLVIGIAARLGEMRIVEIIKGGFTREELDKKCNCGHTREFHTIKDMYCFQFNKDNSSCGCKKFKEEKA